MIVKPQPIVVKTAEQLLQLPADGNCYELVKGELKMMSPAGSEHGRIADRIARRLGDFVETNQLGATFAAETGFQIGTSPDTVRAPDAAFVSQQSLATAEPTKGFLPLAPDLLVEVISPHDRFSDVEQKAQQWLEVGTQIVIVADPVNLLLHIYRQGSTTIEVLRSGDIFSAGDVCGDWQLSVDDVFQI